MGFLSPASRGALLTTTIILYVWLAVVAGFAAVYAWGLMERSYNGWPIVCASVAVFFPGITLAIFTMLNLVIYHTGEGLGGARPRGWVAGRECLSMVCTISARHPLACCLGPSLGPPTLMHASAPPLAGTSGAVPIGMYFMIVLVWFVVSIPLTFVGGYVAIRLPIKDHPVKTNQIPRHIPPPPLAANPTLLLFAGERKHAFAGDM